MKEYDKIVFILSLLACVAGVGVYFGMKPPPGRAETVKVKGQAFTEWKDSDSFVAAPEAWESPELDTETGWNYDMFTMPEITWLSGEKKYIAKELPVLGPVGISLVSLEHPRSRFRISFVSVEAPPKKIKGADGKSRYAAVFELEDLKGNKATVGFRQIPGVSLEKEEFEDRFVYTLQLRSPYELKEQNVAFKNLKILHYKRKKVEIDKSEEDRAYMATFVDRDNKDRDLCISQDFHSDSSRTEAIFQDDASSRQWRYRETRLPGVEEPEIEVFMRESEASPWKSLGNKPSFQAGDATYFVKIVDISAQQATITKQSESDGKSKRTKVRQVVLDLVK